MKTWAKAQTNIPCGSAAVRRRPAHSTKNLAEKGKCVIVGRCADYILRDYENALHVFIHADMDYRAKHIVELYGETDETPEKRLTDKDKMRKANYEYRTDREWGLAQNYDLTLNSGKLGQERCVDIICGLAMAE